ncbi:MAG: enoyl-CoA hydratase-related protein [Pseudomonadaceae bacterium]|nr:enoyl-CoA hydratase-related protein [Pseudomonadaceae bacterium]
MSEDVLLQETHGHVAVLTLNRPERKNACNDELGWSIVNAVQKAAQDDDVRVIGITGSGDAFCSGVDLAREPSSDVSGMSSQDRVLDDLHWVSRFYTGMRMECDKPIVAGINGIAVGAGMALAMCADMRIAKRSARLHPGYIRAATSPDGGLSLTLPQLIGHEKAMRFLLDPRMFPADEALDLGIVGEVADDEAFDERFLGTLAHLASQSPIGARQTKRLVVRALAGVDAEAHLRNEMSYVGRGLGSEDGKEAVKAIMEKRKPVYNGS